MNRIMRIIELNKGLTARHLTQIKETTFCWNFYFPTYFICFPQWNFISTNFSSLEAQKIATFCQAMADMRKHKITLGKNHEMDILNDLFRYFYNLLVLPNFEKILKIFSMSSFPEIVMCEI